MFNFFNLADKPEYIDEVVSWLHKEWGNEKNLNFWSSWVRSSLSKDNVPQTLIVLDENELVGTYSLWCCDLQSRQDLYPWLGGIVVKETRRGQGIGKEIQRHSLEQLHRLGFREAYLFTDMSGYYEKSGWEYLNDIPDEKGEMVRLYRKKIN